MASLYISVTLYVSRDKCCLCYFHCQLNSIWSVVLLLITLDTAVQVPSHLLCGLRKRHAYKRGAESFRVHFHPRPAQIVILPGLHIWWLHHHQHHHLTRKMYDTLQYSTILLTSPVNKHFSVRLYIALCAWNLGHVLVQQKNVPVCVVYFIQIHISYDYVVTNKMHTLS